MLTTIATRAVSRPAENRCHASSPRLTPPTYPRSPQAARRIQSAFKRMLHSKRASSAFAGVLDRSRSPSPSSPELRGRAGAGGAGPGGVRQSGASVLLGSPQINPSSPITSPGLSPQARAAGAAGAPGAGMPRTIEVIGAKRYKQLLTQVKPPVHGLTSSMRCTDVVTALGQLQQPNRSCSRPSSYDQLLARPLG